MTIACDNSSAELSPHLWFWSCDLFFSPFIVSNYSSHLHSADTNSISSLLKICSLNPMAATAANNSIKTVFHKIDVFIILSPFLCKRRTTWEQTCEGLASRSLQIEIHWLLFQWERQWLELSKQTVRVESRGRETGVPGVKSFCPVFSSIPGSIPDTFSTLLGGYSAPESGRDYSLCWYKVVLGRWVCKDHPGTQVSGHFPICC